ncbi:4'-phosphopantetheinyl transferase superfamily protein [Sphaerisporangium sp. NPDC088356]|uniref:4'-phosphopantetheinyl transferase family protein n=1 Tax=Sphaerisporangium sp. NPDC088356 TaxID=3154871 RepID=UPI00341EEBC4
MPPAEVEHLRRLLPPGVRLVALDPAQVDVAAPHSAPLGVRMHPAELALVPRGDLSRERQFIAGRLCARAALREIGARDGPLPIRPDGSPDWPADVRGSISHKPRLCVAAVSRAAAVGGLGIDLEPAQELPLAVWRGVLTDAERARITAGRVHHGRLEPRLIFSAKESYYKWYRSVGGLHDIGFHDVEVDFRGSEIRYHPREPLPTTFGRCVVGGKWLITITWSNPLNES